jgi:hypothetical protein
MALPGVVSSQQIYTVYVGMMTGGPRYRCALRLRRARRRHFACRRLELDSRPAEWFWMKHL